MKGDIQDILMQLAGTIGIGGHDRVAKGITGATVQEQAMNLRLQKDTNSAVKQFKQSLKGTADVNTSIEKKGREIIKRYTLGSQLLNDTFHKLQSADGFLGITDTVGRKLRKTFKDLNITSDYYGKTIETLEDILEFRQGVENLQQLTTAQINYANGVEGAATELIDIRRAMEESDLPKIFKDIAKRTGDLYVTGDANQQKKALEDNIEALDMFTKATTNAAIAAGPGKLQTRLTSAAKLFFSLEAATVTLTRAFGQAVNDLEAMMKYGSINQDVISGNFAQSFMLAMDPAQLSELNAQYRQATFSLRDLQDPLGAWNKQMDDAQKDLFKFTGNTDSAALAAMNLSDILSRSGARGTNGNIMKFSGLIDNFLSIGQTAEETAKLLGELQQDEAVQLKLMNAATEDQRIEILKSIGNQVLYNRTLGMASEQAKAAAIAMGKIAGTDTKTRIKEAARLQMMAGAMGIDGGEKIAELVRMGQRLEAGSPDQIWLQEKLAELGQAVRATKFGSLPAERIGDLLMEKIGSMAEHVSPTGTMATELLKETRGIELEQLEKMKKTEGWQNETLRIWQEWSKSLYRNPLGGAAVGGVQALGSMVGSTVMGGLTLAGLMKIFPSIGSFLGLGGGAALKLAPAAAGLGTMATVGTAGVAGITAAGLSALVMRHALPEQYENTIAPILDAAYERIFGYKAEVAALDKKQIDQAKVAEQKSKQLEEESKKEQQVRANTSELILSELKSIAGRTELLHQRHYSYIESIEEEKLSKQKKQTSFDSSRNASSTS